LVLLRDVVGVFVRFLRQLHNSDDYVYAVALLF
jgi:hypothetical protein